LEGEKMSRLSLYRRTFQLIFATVVEGMLLVSCTIVTDPTKTSSEITSSTTPNSSSKSSPEEKAKSFTRDNFFRLKEDMALGKGEHLVSLATLLGVPEKHQAEFLTLTKEKFPAFVSSEQVTADDMFAALHRELAAHPHLQGSNGHN
jgi:hypothetical protein